MPLLDWQAPRGGPVVSHRFWIYWAVTVPLTAVVLLLWSTWYLISDHRPGQHENRAQRAMCRDGRRGREGLDMRVFTAFGLDRMRGKSERFAAGSPMEEGMTDDV